MHREFRELLKNAIGFSEHVVIAVIDIRGFSNFSLTVDSADTAIFIKKIYTSLMDKYFSEASFIKPMGDGLLVVIPYTEPTLKKTVQDILTKCLQIVNEFKDICAGDPMITFASPPDVGIGLARGSACRIKSGEKTLDYSGKYLNLASRLMDMARPRGIVFESSFANSLIDDEMRARFEQDEVYVQGISEKSPIKISYLNGYTEIPRKYKNPIDDSLQIDPYEYTYKSLKTLGGTFILKMSQRPQNPDEIRVKITHPTMRNGKKYRKFNTYVEYNNFTYSTADKTPEVSIELGGLVKNLDSKAVRDYMKVRIEIIYKAIN